MIIQYLHPDAFRAPLGEVFGFSSHLMAADIELPGGRLERCFVKAFPPGSRGITNEIVHWLTGHAFALPQPPEAHVLLLSLTYLEEWWPQVDWQAGTDCDVYPVFVSAEIPSAAPKTYHAADALLRHPIDLADWHAIEPAIAQQELLQNIDGNRANYVRLGPCSWAIIDGGECFGGQYWTPDSVATLGYFYNKLLHIRTGGRLPTADVVARIDAAAQNQHRVIDNVIPYIVTWVAEMEGMAAAKAIKEALLCRCTPGWFATRYRG